MNNQTATVAELSAPVEPKAARTRKTTTAKKAAPKAAKGANKLASKNATPKSSKKATEASTPRPASKKANVLAMIQRKTGSTLAEIMKATDWQAHSVRGFISGTLRKKMGLAIESTRNDAGERTYKIGK
jgi:hypothetical protein